MDSGFSNLTKLKQHILAQGLRVRTDWDVQLATLGRGVKTLFERYTNRLLTYLAGDTVTFSADRDCFAVPRYPIVSLTGLQSRSDLTTGWVVVTVNDYVAQWDAASGLLQFSDTLGEPTTLFRLTYTGGYWYDTTENDSGSLPTGATAVPDDILHAWHQHCRATWLSIDRLGTDITKSPDATGQQNPRISQIGFSKEVQAILDSYRRFQIT